MSVKNICNKDSVSLFKKTENGINHFFFDYEFKDDRIINLVNNDLFNVVFKLNPELIEDIKIITKTDKDGCVILFFKDILKEIKIKKRFICIDYVIQETNEYLIYKTIPSKKYEFPGYTSIEWNEALIMITKPDDLNKTKFSCKFLIEEDEDVPIYVENTIGKLIKNVFIKLKFLIDTL